MRLGALTLVVWFWICMFSHVCTSVYVWLDIWFVCLDIGYVFGCRLLDVCFGFMHVLFLLLLLLLSFFVCIGFLFSLPALYAQHSAHPSLSLSPRGLVEIE